MTVPSISAAVSALREGKPVLLSDPPTGSCVVLAAEFATPEWLSWTIRNTIGSITAPMTHEIADRLGLPVIPLTPLDNVPIVANASDQAENLRLLADPRSGPDALRRPGIHALRTADGGIRERAAHPEAAIDLLRLAGLAPVAALAEGVLGDSIIELGARMQVPVVTIAALLEHLAEYQPEAAAPARATPSVVFEIETRIPTSHGAFRVRAYLDRRTGANHLAIIGGTPARRGALVRVHSECLTGEVFGSLKCECGPQLETALETIQRESGVVVYMRGQEGRGIGLVNKLRAYRLQEDGLDTLDANIALGFPGDARDYTAASDILRDLGIESVRLLTNNPDKVEQLKAHGITVDERVPLVVGVGELNAMYLETKRDRMGHVIAAMDVRQQ